MGCAKRKLTAARRSLSLIHIFTVEYTSSANEVGVPISVIVNGSTYGAAELFAANIQDYKKGLVVGELTAGRGEKQEILQISDGSAVMLSVAEYLRLDGSAFSGTGVTPDVEKSLDEEQAELLVRRQLELSDDAQVQACLLYTSFRRRTAVRRPRAGSGQ